MNKYELDLNINKFNLMDKINENKYILIDGQQRLTTILLILKYLEDSFDFKKFNFKFKYTTRDNTNILLDKNFKKIILMDEYEIESVDEYHIYKACKTIDDWFKIKNITPSERLDTNIIDLLKKIDFIWYEISEYDLDNPVDIFTRVNSGKIPLTNSELIKGLILNSKNITDENYSIIYSEQVKISKEWHDIELTLQDDSFWYFISNKEPMTSRIDIIFDILAEMLEEEYRFFQNVKNFKRDNNERYSFYVFNKYFDECLKREASLTDIWLKVKQIHMVLIEWYKDFIIYHKIGYLISRSRSPKTINMLVISYFEDKNKYKTKKSFLEKLDYYIEEGLLDGDSIVDFRTLSYTNSKKDRLFIKDILFLHNIETILDQGNNTYDEKYIRFPFNLYKKENWDLEHIYPKSLVDKDISNKEKIEEIYKYINRLSIEVKSDILSSEEKIVEYYDSIFSRLSDENVNMIGNLTLLMKDANIEFSNKHFYEKRMLLIEEYDERNKFIPPCTRKVFLKYYSNAFKEISSWTDQDCEDYFIDIERKLYEYRR